MISHDEYKLKNPDAIQTPAMIIFEHRVDHNIQALSDMIGAENAVVHVKTHKCATVIRKQVAAGVAGFKCATLRELEMTLDAGATDAILAYPLIQAAKIERFVQAVRNHPGATVHATVSQPAHVDGLSAAAERHAQPLNVMLDLDVGFHRTGAVPDSRAVAVYRAIHEGPGLTPTGIHAYDGHDHETDQSSREARAMAHIADVSRLREQLVESGMPVPRVVGGGSFSFPYYAREDGMQGSPGTVIYWDAGYRRMIPDMPFRAAALILTQVVDCHPDQGTVTTDLGIKAVAAEGPVEQRFELPSRPDARIVWQNEEHGVLAFPSDAPALGDYLLAIPGHVCPTTMCYPGSHVIDRDGEIVDYWEHTARDR